MKMSKLVDQIIKTEKKNTNRNIGTLFLFYTLNCTLRICVKMNMQCQWSQSWLTRSPGLRCNGGRRQQYHRAWPRPRRHLTRRIMSHRHRNGVLSHSLQKKKRIIQTISSALFTLNASLFLSLCKSILYSKFKAIQVYLKK
jgi:hypothetical protein